MRNFFLRIVAGWLAITSIAGAAHAFETDQFTNRLEMLRELTDSRDALNALMNAKIKKAVDEWNPRWGENHALFAKKVRGIPFPVNIWVGVEMDSELSPLIDRRLPSAKNIYSKADIEGRRLGIGEQILPNVEGHRRLNWLVRLSSTIKIAGVLLGTDKLGHFLSEGYDAYVKGLNGGGVRAAMKWAYHAENTFEGYEVFGVFSNGDLTANYEGYLFYRSLSEDGVVNGKLAIVKWVDGKPIIQRDFDWADHVNDYWDEALNPCFYIEALQRSVYPKLEDLCVDYVKNPQAYVPRDEDVLKQKYSLLKYRPNLRDRLDQVCAPATMSAPAQISAPATP
jgi:hypothetical protein